LLQYLSTKDKRRNLCQDLLTIQNTDSNLKVRALHYANELLKNLGKLAKQTETIINYQKQVLFMIEHFLGREKRTRSTSAVRYYLSQREIEALFSTLKKLTFSISSGIKLHIGVLDLIPCLFP